MNSASIARLIARHGREVTLQFSTGVGTFSSVTLLAHVMDNRADALVTGATVQQGTREVRIAHVALDNASAPRALRQGDRVVIDGKAAAVMSADPRALSGATGMVVVQVKGA